MQGGPCKHQGHYRDCRKTEGADGEMAEQRNTQSREESSPEWQRQGRHRSPLQTLSPVSCQQQESQASCACGRATAFLSTCCQVLPGHGGWPQSGRDTLPRPGQAQPCGWLRPALPEHLFWLQRSSCSLQSGSAGGKSLAVSFAKMTQHKM